MSQGKALFQNWEVLEPAYSYIKPLSGMALEADGSSRWLPGWGEREVPPWGHRAGCQLTHCPCPVSSARGVWGLGRQGRLESKV